MEEEALEEGSQGPINIKGRHIKKRSLKNKSLSVSFDEKDLTNYVTGFHKRKKKRRKEALLQQDEADRRKRIELRKKRKLERESVYGVPPPDSVQDAAEPGEEDDDDDKIDPLASVSGVTTYASGDVKVTVMTSAISREEESPVVKSEPGRLSQSAEDAKQKIPPIKRKPVVRNPKKRSRPKPQSKRDKRKGKLKNKRQLT